jgi:hypothetical protein
MTTYKQTAAKEVEGGQRGVTDKRLSITSYFLIFGRFTESRANKKYVSTQTLQQEMAKSFQFTFPVFPFKTSSRRTKAFKKNYITSLVMCTFTDNLKNLI